MSISFDKSAFVNDDARLRERAALVSAERHRLDLEGLVGGLEAIIVNVITSYSIHYTKLYEDHAAVEPGQAGGHEHDQGRADEHKASIRRIHNRCLPWHFCDIRGHI